MKNAEFCSTSSRSSLILLINVIIRYGRGGNPSEHKRLLRRFGPTDVLSSVMREILYQLALQCSQRADEDAIESTSRLPKICYDLAYSDNFDFLNDLRLDGKRDED